MSNECNIMVQNLITNLIEDCEMQKNSNPAEPINNQGPGLQVTIVCQ